MTYRYETNKSSTSLQRKARCSIQGDLMHPDIHYDPDETSTYIADKSTVRLLFSLATAGSIHMEQMDLTGAYLHERYEHPRLVYIWQLQRFGRTYKHAARAGQLIGNIYGKHLATHTYTTKFHEHLRNQDSSRTRLHPSFFYKRHTKNIILISISTDNFLTATTV